MPANAIQTRLQYFYNAYFGRPADPSGLHFWEAGIANSGKEIETAIASFGDPRTPEFAQRYPAGTSIESFLDTVYAQMFNRAPDPDGKQFWANAFHNWVNGGIYSEGEARAQIVVQVLNSALGQTGTNDKLATTNKQFVSNAMTESIQAYGTESAYMTDLVKARALLGSVDHTQASVTAALAKIKVGGIYESWEAVPAAPTYVDTFSQIDAVVLSNDKHEILRFDSSSDAPFKQINLGGSWNVLKSTDAVSFDSAVDRIDLKAFHLSSEGGLIASGATPWVVGENVAQVGQPMVAERTYIGFFTKPIIKIAVGDGVSMGTQVFIDVNKNGNLDPGTDLWITLAGVNQSAVTESIFII